MWYKYHKEWKKQPTELEKALANNSSDKGLDRYLDQITQAKYKLGKWTY